MKYLVSVIAVMMLTGSCKSQKLATSNEDKETNEASISKQELNVDNTKNTSEQEGLSFIYEASSRGSMKYISISKNTINLSNDRTLQRMESYSLASEDWMSLKSMADNINLKSLGDLKAPTDKRLYDGAPHAMLTIIYGNVKHKTSTFDDGFPPAEIEALVNKMLALAEKVKKQ